MCCGLSSPRRMGASEAQNSGLFCSVRSSQHLAQHLPHSQDSAFAKGRHGTSGSVGSERTAERGQTLSRRSAQLPWQRGVKWIFWPSIWGHGEASRRPEMGCWIASVHCSGSLLCARCLEQCLVYNKSSLNTRFERKRKDRSITWIPCVTTIESYSPLPKLCTNL